MLPIEKRSGWATSSVAQTIKVNLHFCNTFILSLAICIKLILKVVKEIHWFSLAVMYNETFGGNVRILEIQL